MKHFLSNLRSIMLLTMLTMFSVTLWADDVQIESITMNNPPKTMKVGDWKYVTFNILPEGIENPSVNFESSDINVIDVTRRDMHISLQAINPGKATITATAIDAGGVTTSFEVEVVARGNKTLTDIHADQTSVKLSPGQDVTINVSYAPEDADYLYEVVGETEFGYGKRVYTEFGEIDYNKVCITGIAPGNFQVILQAINNESVSETIDVTVTGEGGEGGEEEDENAPKKIYVPNYIDRDFTDKNINVDNVNWKDSEELNSFIRSLLPETPEGSEFIFNEIVKDFKGYTHVRCYHKVGVYYTTEGREVILHIKDGKLMYVTGDLGLTLSEDSPSLSKASNNDVRTALAKADTNGNAKRYATVPFTGTAVNSKADGYYYKYSVQKNKDINVTQNAEGKYILQDPKRNMYTVNFSTQAVREKNEEAKAQGKEAFKLNGLTMKEALAFADDFTSDTPDFTNLDCNESKLTAFSLSSPVFANATGNFDVAILEEDGQNTKTLYEGKAQVMTVDIPEGPEPVSGTEPGEEGMGGGMPTLVCQIEKGKEPVFTALYRNVDTENKYCHNNWKLRVSKDGNVIGEGYMVKSHCDEENTITFGSEKAMLKTTSDLVKCQSAIDTHYGMACTLDAYKKAFDYDSYDGKGSPVISLVNYGGSNNASAGAYLPLESLDEGQPVGTTEVQKAAVMHFGIGATFPEYNAFVHPINDVETCGHEFTHHVANVLNDKNESGALNESYADIMGKMVERMSLEDYSFLANDYLVQYVGWDCSAVHSGDDVVKPVRSFSNPAICNNPCYYKGQYWQKYEENGQDNGGVHNNCGVQNHWFYLLCTGGEKVTETGEKVNITPISRDDAEAITFLSLRYFAFRHLDYPTARKNSIRVAEIYYGKDSQELKSVYEAWYAVGVGTDEWQPGMPMSINGISNIVDTTSGTRKMLKDGKIIITRNGVEYNVAGARLK